MPAPVSEKKVLKASSPPPMVLSEGIWPLLNLVQRRNVCLGRITGHAKGRAIITARIPRRSGAGE